MDRSRSRSGTRAAQRVGWLLLVSLAVGCSRTPKLTDVKPRNLCANADSDLTLIGSDLEGKKVELDYTPSTGTATSVAAASLSGGGKQLVAHFNAHTVTPMATPYDLVYTDTDGKQLKLPASVTVVESPIVFYVDPPFVYSGIATPVTIYATGVTAPLPATGAVILTPHGGGTAVDLTANAHIDPNHSQHVIVDVPAGLAAGAYDLAFNDPTGCASNYANAITVVSSKVALKDITPPFGYDQSTTAVTIDANGDFFKPGARAYLSKHGATSSPAVPLQSPIAQSTTRLTAIVPNLGALCTSASPAQAVTCNDGLWDVVVVNVDGTIGFFDNGGAGAFTVENLAVPVIASISPGGVVTNCTGTGCDVTIGGENFATTGAATPVTLDCALAGASTHMTFTPTVVSASDRAIVIDVPAATIAAGSVCVPTVNNGPAGNGMFASGGTIAIFQPSFNISTINVGQPLVTARRAPAVAFNGPTLAARYVYAIGGDDGTLDGTSHLPTGGIDTVEMAAQDPFAGEQPWAVLPAQARLPAAITLAGVASVGHFIYLVGGYDTRAKGSLSTVYRAQVLQPGDAPQIDDADLTPDANDGLANGLYFYRIAAVLKADDAQNPGGETLAGDEFAINVPQYKTDKFQITLSWTGGPTNVDHWRIYRTSAPGMMPGSEDVVYVTADASSRTFVDKGGTLTPFVAGTPQPFGGLGVWAAQPALNVHRAGAGVAVVVDPSAPTSKAYLYAGFGFDSTATTAGFPTSYELLDVDPTTAAASGTWSAPADIKGGVGGATTEVGRWLTGAFAVTPDVDSAACPAPDACQAYVFFGSGADSVAAEAAGAGAVGNTAIARVTPGSGVLSFGSSGSGSNDYGYGALTATNWIFEVGGAANGGPTNKVNADTIDKAATTSTTPTMGATFQPQGTGALEINATAAPRLLPGVVFGPPFFYTVGGCATVGGPAKSDTFYDVF